MSAEAGLPEGTRGQRQGVGEGRDGVGREVPEERGRGQPSGGEVVVGGREAGKEEHLGAEGETGAGKGAGAGQLEEG